MAQAVELRGLTLFTGCMNKARHASINGSRFLTSHCGAYNSLMKATLVVVATALLTVLSVSASADEATSSLSALRAEFELVDRDGELVNIDRFRGENLLLAFGFTHCEHICPMIAANMARALRATEKPAAAVFISVDTERDTPMRTDDYARAFDERIVGLSGSHAQVAAAARNFQATFVVTKSEDNYTVQHTPSIFLIGPDGEIIEVFAMNTASDEIAGAMR